MKNTQSELTDVSIFTDGACLGNPGPGGWAAILNCQGKEKELSAGFKLTTNNRMEVLAAIKGLEALTRPCQVTLYTDSKYLCDAVEKHWLTNWRRNGWVTAGKKPVKNRDLWEMLIEILKKHTVTFKWVRGHSGHPENERCDQLAKSAAQGADLAEDTGFKG